MRKFAPNGKTGVLARTAITQTFATADATLAAFTYAAPQAAPTVTDGAGTNDGTIGAITDNASTIAAIQEVVAYANSLRTQLVALAADHADLAACFNSVVDALQARGDLG